LLIDEELEIVNAAFFWSFALLLALKSEEAAIFSSSFHAVKI